MAGERYFIGPSLRDKLRETILRVDAIPSKETGATIPTVSQEMAHGPRHVFRICTFTGAWSKNSTKVVTFKFQTNTPNTVQASNLFATVTNTATTTATINCAIARDGTAWYLIAAECNTAAT